MGLCDATRVFVETHGGRLVNVTGDDFAYWRSLADAWREAAIADEPLVVQEQDILPTAEQLLELEDCPEPWCAFPYQIDGRDMPALGFTKFSAAFRHRHPDFMQRVGEIGPADDQLMHPSGFWGVLDTRTGRAMGELTPPLTWPHMHEPPVEHLNPHQRR